MGGSTGAEQEEFERVIEGAAKRKVRKKKKGIVAAPMSPDRPASRIAADARKMRAVAVGAVDALPARS
jgi:hypothetical protein